MTKSSQSDAAAGQARRALGGEAAAIDELLIQELPALRAYVRLNVDPLLRARESCSDLVQSVCRAVLQHDGSFDYRGPAAFRAWLYSWTLNKIRDRRKFYLADKRHPGREMGGGSDDSVGLSELYAPLHTPSQDAVACELAERIERAFDAMPERYRQVIALARIARLPYPEIAIRLGVEVTKVRGLLHRALARLSTVMDRDPAP